jgi:hypothetical protein
VPLDAGLFNRLVRSDQVHYLSSNIGKTRVVIVFVGLLAYILILQLTSNIVLWGPFVIISQILRSDINMRFFCSGPRCGLHELILPENEPGSSIMPVLSYFSNLVSFGYFFYLCVHFYVVDL